MSGALAILNIRTEVSGSRYLLRLFYFAQAIILLSTLLACYKNLQKVQKVIESKMYQQIFSRVITCC